MVPDRPDRPDVPTAQARFAALLRQALADGRWQRLVLSMPQAAAAGVQRVAVRPLLLRGAPHLSFVSSHATKDVTQNLPVDAGLAHIAQLLDGSFRAANLLMPVQTAELRISKRGSGHLALHAQPGAAQPQAAARSAPAAPLPQATPGTAQDAAAEAAPDSTANAPPNSPPGTITPAAPHLPTPPAPHDRIKQRWLSLDRPFLHALGITTAQHQLVPAMARKWKQINKFLEVFAHALARSPLAGRHQLHVVDFGAGKAYLSFAVHDWLTHAQGLDAQVTGVELRPDLVAQGQQTAALLGLAGMRLVQGDVREGYSGPIDVMIALHACDTATDHAIALGLRAGAQIILCSPCCHKQLRPQLLSPHPLRSVFQHGIHAEQQAEMLTDSLRALLLQAQGYDTQVFEFVALEHTRKNKMILAVRRAQPQPAAAADALAQVAELKRYFGVREQCLETLLQG